MSLRPSPGRIAGTILALSLSALGLVPARGNAADYGRIVGTVADAQGAPLMGATVLIVGPMLNGLQAGGNIAERVLTDARGRFAVERLLPGWYSLQVISPTRLPILRNGVRVESGQSVQQSFVLGDILAPIRLNVPSGNVSNWGEDWKWVLRTAASTRPILRYQPETKAKPKSKEEKIPLPASQRLIAMNPGSSSGRALAGDPGVGSVLAYIRPLSENSDLMLAGSMGASGMQSSSLATVLRKDALKGDPQELALVVHQLNVTDGIPTVWGDSRESRNHAQAIVASYSQARRLFGRMVLTAGFELDYLNAGSDVLSSRPYMKAEYEASPSNLIAVRYGAARVDAGTSLLDRIGALTSFPRVTMRGFQPELEKLNHAEISYTRRLGKNTRIETAVYRDEFGDAALWGFGTTAALANLAGSYLPNPAADGVTLNAGNYSSSGVRAALVRKLGNETEISVLYAVGDALATEAREASPQGSIKDLRAALRTQQTQAIGGRVSTRLPRSHTLITTSYQWIPYGRVTSVDPVGQANLQMQPYLGIQIRQPLPNLAFLPARVEALADFRNLLSQGYVPVYTSGEDTLLITPSYRSFRGGFSVQF
jgi:hypothetical protein